MRWLLRYRNEAYSQEGEDLILKRYFGNKRKGFYVDVGAHHPRRFSNTYVFYKLGWSGINIDALPGVMSAFKNWRSRDINLEIGISEKEGALTYYQFADPAINGFDAALAEQRKSSGSIPFIGEKVIKTFPLKAILEKHVPANTSIDFLSVDVEGLDLEVLKSNDWSRFRPTLVLTEIYDLDLHKPELSPIHNFMISCDYRLYAKCVNTIFYEKKR